MDTFVIIKEIYKVRVFNLLLQDIFLVQEKYEWWFLEPLISYHQLKECHALLQTILQCTMNSPITILVYFHCKMISLKVSLKYIPHRYLQTNTDHIHWEQPRIEWTLHSQNNGSICSSLSSVLPHLQSWKKFIIFFIYNGQVVLLNIWNCCLHME